MKSNRRLHVLAMLRAARPGYVTTSQLAAEIMPDGRHLGARYGGRLQELRDQGHRITSERLGESEWAYRLTFDADLDTPTDESGGSSSPQRAAGLVGDSDVESSGGVSSPLPAAGLDAEGQDAGLPSEPSLFSLAEIDIPKRPAYFDPDAEAA